MLAQAHFGGKQLHGLSRSQQREKLLQKGIDWHAQPNWFKYGALIKKELYEKLSKDPRTDKEVLATRTRLVLRSFRLSEFHPTLVSTLTTKYWESSFQAFALETELLVDTQEITDRYGQ